MMPHHPPSADPGGGERSRLHYLDAMRSHLMLLGVVLHAARPYDSNGWLVKDAYGGAGFDGIVWLVHLFRMPAFFVVAGYFAMLLLLRQPTRLFIRERLRRTLVPMVATLLALNLFQTWWLHREAIHGVESFVRDALIPDWQSGRVLGHLWFLLYLAIYNLLAAAATPLLRKFAANPRWQTPFDDRRVFWLLAAGVIMYPLAWPVIARGAPGLFDHMLFGLVDLMDLFGYLPFFAFGLLLYVSPALFRRFMGRGASSLLALIAVGAAGLLLSSGGDGLLSRVVQVVSGSLLTWMSVRVVFMLFRRWADRPSRINRYLSDASYSIYLFHHLFVVMVTSLLLPVALPAWVKFTVVLVAASLVSLTMHHCLVRGHAPMRYLFNGKLGPTHRKAPGTAAVDPVRVPRPADVSR